MSDCSDIDNYCFYDDDDDDYVYLFKFILLLIFFPFLFSFLNLNRPAFNKINKEIFIGSNVLCLESGSIVDAQVRILNRLNNLALKNFFLVWCNNELDKPRFVYSKLLS